MTQQELNLLQFASGGVAELCTGPAEVVKRELVDARFCSIFPNHMPKTPFRSIFPPGFSLLCTRRNSLPEVMFAAWSQWSKTCLTQAGVGMVRV